MTWLYVPSISAPDTEDSSSLCAGSEYQPWLMLSGMPTRRPFSWNGWARRVWIRSLCGTISNPLMAQRGVDAWISSLRGSRALTSRRPVSGPELTASTGSGPRSRRSSATWNRASSSWKTSPDLWGSEDLPESSVTLPSSGSMRNGVCSLRPTLEPLTTENGSGLWPTATSTDSLRKADSTSTNETLTLVIARGWPTPMTVDAFGGSHDLTATDRPRDRGAHLKDVTRQWGTPVARDDQKSPQAHLEMKQRMGGNRTVVTSLTVQSKLWNTPTAAEMEGNGHRSGDRADEPKLKGQARQWSTPRASAQENRGTAEVPSSENGRHGRRLVGDASKWGTPRAADAFKGTDPPHGQGGQTGLKQQLRSHLRAKEPMMAGETGSPRADLNPFFVATLMGLPMDWLTHSTSAVTASCHKQLLKPSDNSAPAQDGN